MEDILELILTILFQPFESKYDDTFGRIKNIRSKSLRIFLRILLIAIPLACIFGLCCLCNYLFRGYWIWNKTPTDLHNLSGFIICLLRFNFWSVGAFFERPRANAVRPYREAFSPIKTTPIRLSVIFYPPLVDFIVKRLHREAISSLEEGFHSRNSGTKKATAPTSQNDTKYLITCRRQS